MALTAARQAGAEIAGGDREDGEQAVADEFQHLAAEGLDRRHEALEVHVQQVDQVVAREPFRQRREAAQIGNPDRGMYGFAIAALDQPRQHLGPAALAEIGLEEGRRDVALHDNLELAREQLREEAQLGPVGVREAARPGRWRRSRRGASRR